MQWLVAAVPHVLAPGALAASITPVGSAADSLTTYILGFGPLGIIALALAWAQYKGLFTTTKAADKARNEAVSLARADLVRENERLLARAEKAEEQRDEALKVSQEQIVPLLSQFVGTTSALLPVLQQIVARGGVGNGK